MEDDDDRGSSVSQQSGGGGRRSGSRRSGAAARAQAVPPQGRRSKTEPWRGAAGGDGRGEEAGGMGGSRGGAGRDDTSEAHDGRAARDEAGAAALGGVEATSSLAAEIALQRRRAEKQARRAVGRLDRTNYETARGRRMLFAAVLLSIIVVVETVRIALRLDDRASLARQIASAVAVACVAACVLLLAWWERDHRRARLVEGAMAATYTAMLAYALGTTAFLPAEQSSFALFAATTAVFLAPSGLVLPYSRLAPALPLVGLVVLVGLLVSRSPEALAAVALLAFYAVVALLPRRILESLTRRLRRVYADIEAESHTQLVLLQRVIPHVFLEELFSDQRIVSTAPHVAVLFCEVLVTEQDPRVPGVRVTHKMGTNLRPDTLRVLAAVFRVLDQVVDHNRCFKVETIGSEFMAVSGLPSHCRHPANPTLALAKTALDMMRALSRRPDLASAGVSLQIGIHCGTAVEAILGRTLLPRWKLFGDTVNTASRMKSNGRPGCVHLSQAARDAIVQPALDFLRAQGQRELNAARRAWSATNGPLRSTAAPDLVQVPRADRHDPLPPGCSSYDELRGLGTTDYVMTMEDEAVAAMLGFWVVPRPRRWIKGKGLMQTYLLEAAVKGSRRRASAELVRDPRFGNVQPEIDLGAIEPDGDAGAGGRGEGAGGRSAPPRALAVHQLRQQPVLGGPPPHHRTRRTRADEEEDDRRTAQTASVSDGESARHIMLNLSDAEGSHVSYAAERRGARHMLEEKEDEPPEGRVSVRQLRFSPREPHAMEDRGLGGLGGLGGGGGGGGDDDAANFHNACHAAAPMPRAAPPLPDQVSSILGGEVFSPSVAGGSVTAFSSSPCVHPMPQRRVRIRPRVGLRTAFYARELKRSRHETTQLLLPSTQSFGFASSEDQTPPGSLPTLPRPGSMGGVALPSSSPLARPASFLASFSTTFAVALPTTAHPTDPVTTAHDSSIPLTTTVAAGGGVATTMTGTTTIHLFSATETPVGSGPRMLASRVAITRIEHDDDDLEQSSSSPLGLSSPAAVSTPALVTAAPSTDDLHLSRQQHQHPHHHHHHHHNHHHHLLQSPQPQGPAAVAEGARGLSASPSRMAPLSAQSLHNKSFGGAGNMWVDGGIDVGREPIVVGKLPLHICPPLSPPGAGAQEVSPPPRGSLSPQHFPAAGGAGMGAGVKGATPSTRRNILGISIAPPITPNANGAPVLSSHSPERPPVVFLSNLAGAGGGGGSSRSVGGGGGGGGGLVGGGGGGGGGGGSVVVVSGIGLLAGVGGAMGGGGGDSMSMAAGSDVGRQQALSKVARFNAERSQREKRRKEQLRQRGGTNSNYAGSEVNHAGSPTALSAVDGAAGAERRKRRSTSRKLAFNWDDGSPRSDSKRRTSTRSRAKLADDELDDEEDAHEVGKRGGGGREEAEERARARTTSPDAMMRRDEALLVRSGGKGKDAAMTGGGGMLEASPQSTAAQIGESSPAKEDGKLLVALGTGTGGSGTPKADIGAGLMMAGLGSPVKRSGGPSAAPSRSLSRTMVAAASTGALIREGTIATTDTSSDHPMAAAATRGGGAAAGTTTAASSTGGGVVGMLDDVHRSLALPSDIHEEHSDRKGRPHIVPGTDSSPTEASAVEDVALHTEPEGSHPSASPSSPSRALRGRQLPPPLPPTMSRAANPRSTDALLPAAATTNDLLALASAEDLARAAAPPAAEGASRGASGPYALAMAATRGPRRGVGLAPSPAPSPGVSRRPASSQAAAVDLSASATTAHRTNTRSNSAAASPSTNPAPNPAILPSDLGGSQDAPPRSPRSESQVVLRSPVRHGGATPAPAARSRLLVQLSSPPVGAHIVQVDIGGGDRAGGRSSGQSRQPDPETAAAVAQPDAPDADSSKESSVDEDTLLDRRRSAAATQQQQQQEDDDGGAHEDGDEMPSASSSSSSSMNWSGSVGTDSSSIVTADSDHGIQSLHSPPHPHPQGPPSTTAAAAAAGGGDGAGGGATGAGGGGGSVQTSPAGGMMMMAMMIAAQGTGVVPSTAGNTTGLPSAATTPSGASTPAEPLPPPIPTAQLNPWTLQFIELSSSAQHVEREFDERGVTRASRTTVAGLVIVTVVCIGETLNVLDSSNLWWLALLFAAYVFVAWTLLTPTLYPVELHQFRSRVALTLFPRSSSFQRVGIAATFCTVAFSAISAAQLLSSSDLGTISDIYASYLFAATHLLVQLVAVNLWGLPFFTYLILSPFLYALFLAAMLVRHPSEFIWAIASGTLMAMVTVASTYVSEVELRRVFYVQYVAEEGSKVTSAMLHAMLPKAVAAKLLHRAFSYADTIDASTANSHVSHLPAWLREILEPWDLLLSPPLALLASQLPRRAPPTHQVASSSGRNNLHPPALPPTTTSGAAAAALPPVAARNISSASFTHPSSSSDPQDSAAPARPASPGHSAGGRSSRVRDEADASSLSGGVLRHGLGHEGSIISWHGGVGDVDGSGGEDGGNSSSSVGGGTGGGFGVATVAQPVSLLMFDMCGFTQLSSEIGPHSVVAMLDTLYIEFDRIVQLHGAYKVETIGDAFLVCCGAPEPRPPSESATIVAKCALDMMDVVHNFRAPGDRPIQARIGLHSGQVLAGIIGDQMPRYQLFGPAVDIAMDMESSSKPGYIHASPQFLSLIYGVPDLRVTARRSDGTGFIDRRLATLAPSASPTSRSHHHSHHGFAGDALSPVGAGTGGGGGGGALAPNISPDHARAMVGSPS